MTRRNFETSNQQQQATRCKVCTVYVHGHWIGPSFFIKCIIMFCPTETPVFSVHMDTQKLQSYYHAHALSSHTAA